MRALTYLVSALVFILLALPSQMNAQDQSGAVEETPTAIRFDPNPVTGCEETGYYYQDYSGINSHEPHHTGRDWKCPYGHPVKSPAWGMVFQTPSNWYDFGNDLWILHGFGRDGNPVLSFYAHLDSVTVVRGQVVERGDIIAYAGTSGPQVFVEEGFAVLHHGFVNKFPKEFGYFYEHASESRDGRGWINPDDYLGQVVTLHGFDGAALLTTPFDHSSIPSEPDWVERHGLDRSLLPVLGVLIALFLVLIWLGPMGAIGLGLAGRLGWKIARKAGIAAAEVAQAELKTLIFDVRGKIRGGMRIGCMAGLLVGFAVVWVTANAERLSGVLVQVQHPTGISLILPKGWVEREGFRQVALTWPPQMPELTMPWQEGEMANLVIESVRTRIVGAGPFGTGDILAEAYTAAASSLPQGNLPFPYWNGSAAYFDAPPEVWGAAVEAAKAVRDEGIVCDPILVVAVAHSESPNYNNEVCSSAGACGVWQFMPGTFEHYADPGSDRFNLYDSAKAACRMTSALGLDSETSEEGFVANFAGLDGSLVWNRHTEQARYVWRLQQWVKQEMGILPPFELNPDFGESGR